MALTKDEEGRLDAIYKKTMANQVPDVRILQAGEIQDVEPNCIGTKALYSPRTAIVSYGAIAKKLQKKLNRKWHIGIGSKSH